MRILMIGDIIGKPGRRAVRQLVPGLRNKYQLDLVIANGENAAGGMGLTSASAQELLSAGVDVLTSGNHIWDQKEIIPHLNGPLPLLRPLNYPPGVPGKGYLVHNGALIVNLMGRTFMNSLDCPFRGMDALLASLPDRPPVIVVDFHAEATSEKGAMGHYLDGRASAVMGTHTHIGTIDTQILPRGTAYVTDVGMTGPVFSVIGDEVESVLSRFLTRLPHRLGVGKGDVIFNGVVIDVDDSSGKATRIFRISQQVGVSGDEGRPSPA